jgi:hypothetical protein
VAFLGGLAAISFALLSGIDRYDTTLFSVHMAQHILLTLVAAPLLVLSAPITLLLRVATPGVRRRWILPVLHSRVVRALSFPVVAWTVFAAVMWATHFSPLDLALEDARARSRARPLPRLGDPVLVAGRRRRSDAVRMPRRSGPCMWPSRCRRTRSWRSSCSTPRPRPTRITSAGAAVGTVAAARPADRGRDHVADRRPDLPRAVIGLVWAWMRQDERDAARADRQADAALAAIREREARLTERLSGDRAP